MMVEQKQTCSFKPTKNLSTELNYAEYQYKKYSYNKWKLNG